MQKYLNKVSGPLLDRIDLHVEVTPVSYEELTHDQPEEGSHDIRSRVIEARLLQEKRYAAREGIHCNAQMSSQDLALHCAIDEAGNALLKRAMDNLGLSARAYDRILKVARTVADLGKSEKIEAVHLSEAIQFRTLDRDNWAG